MSILEVITERWNAELPTFFKKIRTLSLSLGGPATAVWLANQTMSLDLPSIILTACKLLIAFCAAMGLTAQLTKADTPTQ